MAKARLLEAKAWRQSMQPLGAIPFNFDHAPGSTLRAAYRLAINDFNGVPTPQLMIEQVENNPRQRAVWRACRGNRQATPIIAAGVSGRLGAEAHPSPLALAVEPSEKRAVLGGERSATRRPAGS